MAGNSFGEIFRVTSFGESHGDMIGVVIDGCPAGLLIDRAFVQAELDRRRPAQSKISSQRKESDVVRFVSGVFEGKSLGSPICALIKNEDARSSDYAHLLDAYRPSHADFTYDAKYGHRDPRGGGRASARETASRVVAGALAKIFLKQQGISIFAYVSQVGHIGLDQNFTDFNPAAIESNVIRCPDPKSAEKMLALIEEVKKQGDTVGGVVNCVAQGVPAGLGEPVFDRLNADLGKAMLSINAAKGFEIGSGFAGVEMRGSEHNDLFEKVNEKILTKSNHSGGIQGGISNGMDIYFRVAFKPVATLMKPQESINKAGEPIVLEGKGRHDPCVVPRAVPIVESMAALVLADHLLRHRATRL